MFTQLKDLLSRKINREGLSGEIQALEIINLYKKYCREILGEEALENLIPRFFKNKKLYVDAANSSWAQHLHIKQTELLDKINERLTKQPLESFCIQIKNKSLTTEQSSIN